MTKYLLSLRLKVTKEYGSGVRFSNTVISRNMATVERVFGSNSNSKARKIVPTLIKAALREEAGNRPRLVQKQLFKQISLK